MAQAKSVRILQTVAKPVVKPKVIAAKVTKPISKPQPKKVTPAPATAVKPQPKKVTPRPPKAVMPRTGWVSKSGYESVKKLIKNNLGVCKNLDVKSSNTGAVKNPKKARILRIDLKKGKENIALVGAKHKCQNGVKNFLSVWTNAKISTMKNNFFQEIYAAIIKGRNSCLAPFDSSPKRKLQRILETPRRAFLFRVKEEYAKVRARPNLSYKNAQSVSEFFQKGFKEKCFMQETKAVSAK